MCSSDLTKTPLSTLKKEINKKYGTYHFIEDECHLSQEKMHTIRSILKNPNLEILQKAYHLTLQTHLTLDGLKLLFNDGSWVLIRPSGTEPVLRIYTESLNKSTSTKLIYETKALIQTL